MLLTIAAVLSALGAVVYTTRRARIERPIGERLAAESERPA